MSHGVRRTLAAALTLAVGALGLNFVDENAASASSSTTTPKEPVSLSEAFNPILDFTPALEQQVLKDPHYLVYGPAVDVNVMGYTILCDVDYMECAYHGNNFEVVRSELKSMVEGVNTRGNTTIVPINDIDSQNKDEVWSFPIALDDTNPTLLGGDCEDYVLWKKRELLRMGIPEGATSIVLVNTNGDANAMADHAVLLVRMADGDYILDNRFPNLMTPQESGYAFKYATSFTNAQEWKEISINTSNDSPLRMNIPLPIPRPADIS